jgi:hypothetical protein
VEKGINKLALAGSAVTELRLSSCQLAHRVQLAKEKLPAGIQDARGFGKDRRQVFDVLQNKHCYDDFGRSISERPGGTNVMLNKTDPGIVYAGSSPGEHLFRKIQSYNLRGTIRKPGRIATCTAAHFNYFAIVKVKVDLPQNFRSQITRLVLNHVIGLGPIVVGRSNFGLVCYMRHNLLLLDSTTTD